MATRTKIIVGILLVGVVVASTVVFYQKKEINTSTKRLLYKELYRDPGDREGRTVLFRYANGKGYFDGVTDFSDPAKLKDKGHVTGRVAGWEDAPGSVDKYLVLDNPLTREEAQQYRVRIVFDPKSPTAAVFGNDTTELAVQDLYEVQKGFINNKKAAEPQKIQPIDLAEKKLAKDDQFTFEGIQQLVLPGDAVVVWLRFRLEAGAPIQKKFDEGGNPLGTLIMVRREGGRKRFFQPL